jgi:squalene monooxygenase
MPYINDTPSPSDSDKTGFVDEKEQRRRLHHDADVVIVGAGVVGCAMAVAMGKQGRSVLLLERSLKEPDRIVGELLQPGGVKALEQLGLAGTSHRTDYFEGNMACQC